MAVNYHNDEDEEVEYEKQNMLAIVPTTLANIESLTFPLVQEVVVLADFRCKRCQHRVADIVSKLNGEAESVEISLKEKQVTLTLTRRHPKGVKMPKNEPPHSKLHKNRTAKLSLLKRVFSSSSSN